MKVSVFSESYTILMRLVCFVVLTRMLLLILPGKKYYVYMKLLIGFCIMTLMISYMNGLFSVSEFSENSDTYFQKESKNDEKQEFEKYAQLSDLSMLSTCEKEIKSRLNKEKITDKIYVKSVKIKVCEDVDSVDYGKIIEAVIEISSNVDKSVNIEVNNIIVGQNDEKSENSEAESLRKKAAEIIGIEEACVKIVG